MTGVTGRSGTGDEAVDEFVDANVISFAAWDLVAYLSQQPARPCTVESLSRLLSRPESDVEAAVKRLAETRVLVVSAEDDATIYRLTEDAEIRDVIARFVALSTRREHRLDFVRRVLARVSVP